MEISHEVPKSILEQSKYFNDYQYALVHLLEKDEDYKNHFLKCKEEGIPIYLDNSLHELGEAIGGEILMKWVNILEPKYVFIPDVWEDFDLTLRNAKHYKQYQYPESTTPVAVVQATSLHEANICYRLLKDLGYRKIAFSYGASYYKEFYPNLNVNFAKALGRLHVISKLYELGTISKNDNIHLLGCASPIEFLFQKEFPFIKSIDTSNPIMSALEGVKYGELLNHNKPVANMNSHFDFKVKSEDLILIYYNVKKFKNIFL